MSQFSPSGIGSACVGVASPCFQNAEARFVQISIDRTGPIPTLLNSSRTCCDAGEFELKTETWVARPVSFAPRAISRHSHTLCAIGFWLYTCFPARIDAIAIGPCQ